MLNTLMNFLGLSGFADSTSELQPSGRRVAVIGGGIAGLNASLELASQGANVTIFDAASRVGGHIHTVRPDGIGPVERGAEVVDAGDKTIIGLCERYGVSLADRYQAEGGRDEAAYFHHGKRITQEELNKDWRKMGDLIAELQGKLRDASGRYTTFAREMDAMSMDELLESLSDGVNPVIPDIIKTTFRSDCGQDTSRQSALALLEAIDGKSEDFKPVALEENLVFRDGSGSLIQALAQDAKSKGVHGELGSRLVAIDASSGNGVALTFEKTDATGKTYREMQQVDEVVLTLPLHALRNVRGLETLGLSDEQLRVIRDTQYTNLVKMTFEVKEKPWEKFEKCCGDVVASGTAFQQSWVSSAGGKTQKPLVTMLVGGSASDEHGIAKLIEQCRHDYAAIWNMDEKDVFANKSPVAITDWRKNACYASPAKGQYAPLMEFPRLTGNGKVAFAGCYLPVQNEQGTGSIIGYMECGAKSGMEAAKLLGAAQMQELTVPSSASIATNDDSLADTKWQDYVEGRAPASQGVAL